jgi:hypothetical protein
MLMLTTECLYRISCTYCGADIEDYYPPIGKENLQIYPSHMIPLEDRKHCRYIPLTLYPAGHPSHILSLEERKPSDISLTFSLYKRGNPADISLSHYPSRGEETLQLVYSLQLSLSNFLSSGRRPCSFPSHYSSRGEETLQIPSLSPQKKRIPFFPFHLPPEKTNPC